MPVSSGETTDNATTGDGSVDDGDSVREFRFEDAVKVFGTTVSDQAVRICEF